MTTPVHATTKTGSKGELKAAVIFTDIGWAPPVKFSQDIGTDFVTFARDTAAPDEKADAWDLGALILHVDQHQQVWQPEREPVVEVVGV